jgi:hypothetical protein
LSNTATVTVPAGVSDPTSSNNSATDTDTITVAALRKPLSKALFLGRY